MREMLPWLMAGLSAGGVIWGMLRLTFAVGRLTQRIEQLAIDTHELRDEYHELRGGVQQMQIHVAGLAAQVVPLGSGEHAMRPH